MGPPVLNQPEIPYYFYFRIFPHHNLHLYGCYRLIYICTYMCCLYTLYKYIFDIYIYIHCIYDSYISISIYIYTHNHIHIHTYTYIFIRSWSDRRSGPLRHGGNLRRSRDFTWPVATWSFGSVRMEETSQGPQGKSWKMMGKW